MPQEQPDPQNLIHDHDKAEDMAYAMKPHIDDALALDGLKQRALNVLGEMKTEVDERVAAGEIFSGKESQVRAQMDISTQREHAGNLDIAARHSRKLANRASDKAEKEYDEAKAAEETKVDELDRERLNVLTRAALESKNYFGKHLELTEADHEQFKLIADKMKAILGPAYEDKQWLDFMKLVDEGAAKGAIGGWTMHKGTRVPTWCIDGGTTSEVKKIMRPDDQGRAGIQVPTSVYNLFHWRQVVNTLEEYARLSNETIKGRSTEDLGQALSHARVYLKNHQPDS